jgi:hypothetical protein
MPRLLTVLVAAVTAAVAVPAVADAATLHQDGHTHRILLQDAVGETNLVSVEGARAIVIHDANAPIAMARVPTCMRVDARTVSCAAVRHLEVDLGPGPDVATVDTPLDVEIQRSARSWAARPRRRAAPGSGAGAARWRRQRCSRRPSRGWR